MTRVIVCGGRAYGDKDQLFATLDGLHASTPITMLVHGGAPGADSLAGLWAQERGVPVEVHPADWQRYRRSGGPRRNQEMADAGADLCVAFPGGRGTSDMRRRAESAGIKVIRPAEHHVYRGAN